MIDNTISVEADSLDEARAQLRSKVPEGLDVLSEQVISDGTPLITDEQTIEVEADSLEEARERLTTQTPTGLQLLSEHITSDGEPTTVTAAAGTTAAAFTEAQSRIPHDADILEKKELVPSERRVFAVEAFDEQTAHSSAELEARKRFGNAAVVTGLSVAIPGKKGFLGIGKTPDQYEAEAVVRQATVEISYKLKARIVAKVGIVQERKARLSATVGPLATALDEVVTAMCKHPGRSFDMRAHAAPLYGLLSRSQIPKDVAELFVEVTTFTAAFAEVRTTESVDAMRKLCAIKGGVVDNMLVRIAKMSNAQQETVLFDMTGTTGSSTRISKVSFESQRNMARAELARRGSPKYDAKYYVEGDNPAVLSDSPTTPP